MCIDKESSEELTIISGIIAGNKSNTILTANQLISIGIPNDAIVDAINSTANHKQAIQYILQTHQSLGDILYDTVKANYPQYEEYLRKLMVLV
jgi:hypothetical protein